ncbi:MAG: hypothetical protein R3Y33_08835 [Clostridia bacterium]
MSYKERLKIYEQLKAKISDLNLSQSEYEKRIKNLADILEI